MQLNAIERAIAAISPRWAVQRMAYRSVFQTATLSYDAARAGRRGDGWTAGSTSANAEIVTALTTVRNRARDLVRNNPYASIVPTKLAAKTWGTGIVPRLRIGEIDDPRRARDRGIWEMFCDNCDPEGRLDFYGQINVGARAMFESGEFLIR